MPAQCPAANTASIEQENFWDGNWDAHKVGWLISGIAAAITCLVSALTIAGHTLHYNRPLEQRQIIRILLFAPVFAVVSFLSYRFFRKYTYYELVEVVWEAVAIAAFLMLMLQYIGESIETQVQVFVKKDKKKLPLPFCCWRYRPSKAYFLFFLKWSVLQYVIIRPALSVAGIVLEHYEILCNQSLSPQYGHVYLEAIDFVSISVALYGLIVLYGLVRQELKGRRPLMKFMTIKLGIFFTFYQSFVFSILQDHGVIKATEYWTAENVSDGLNALCVTLEMVLIAIFQAVAFPWTEYRVKNLEDGTRGKPNAKGRTNPFWSLLHALNFWDFAVEFARSIRFAFARIRGKEWTRQDAGDGKLDFLVFQGGKRAYDKGHYDDVSRDGTATLHEETNGQHAFKYQTSSPPPQMSMTADALAMQPLQRLDSPYTGAGGSTRSEVALLPPGRQSDEPSAYAQQEQAPPPPMPVQQHMPSAAGPDASYLQAGHATGNAPQAAVTQERPRSWEPQAM